MTEFNWHKSQKYSKISLYYVLCNYNRWQQLKIISNKMHSEIVIIPQNMHASHIRQKISEKISSAIKATATEEQVNYVDLIYLVNGRKIHQNVITAFLSKIYSTQFQQINQKWKQKLSQQKILDDVYKIKRNAVEQQWTQININEKNVKQKQERYKKYQSSLKNRRQVNHRIKEISDNLKILENNINMCKKQTEQLKLRQQYQQMRQQLRFLTNKSRKLKHLSQEKMINSSLSKSQEKLRDIYQRIEEISIEEKRLKQIQHLKFNKKQSTKSQENSPKKSKHRLKKLEQIFIEFSRKQVKQFMLFDEIMKTHKYMSLQNYLRFVTCSGIANQLTLDQKVAIFKNVSQFNSKISFLEFIQILKQICMKQCEKLNVKFHASILDTFLEEMAMRLQNSGRKNNQDPLLSNSNQFIKKLRSQVFSNYQFKIKSHTGKEKNDIKQYLLEKKKSNKTQPSINMANKKSNVTLAKITDSIPSISRNGQRIQTFKTDNKFIKRKLTSNYQTVNIHQNQSITSQSRTFKTSFEKDTYSNIFLRKKNYPKSQKKQQKVNDDEALSKNQIYVNSFNINDVKKQSFINLTPATYQHTTQKNGLEHDQLKDIVQIDQDDPFLTNHLALNYSLKTNKVPCQQSRHHF